MFIFWSACRNNIFDVPSHFHHGSHRVLLDTLSSYSQYQYSSHRVLLHTLSSYSQYQYSSHTVLLHTLSSYSQYQYSSHTVLLHTLSSYSQYYHGSHTDRLHTLHTVILQSLFQLHLLFEPSVCPCFPFTVHSSSFFVISRQQ